MQCELVPTKHRFIESLRTLILMQMMKEEGRKFHSTRSIAEYKGPKLVLQVNMILTIKKTIVESDCSNFSIIVPGRHDGQKITVPFENWLLSKNLIPLS